MPECAFVRDNFSVRVTVRTGDVAILVGAAAIAVYEVKVADDEDLISRRISAYRRHPVGRIIADAVIIATAIHLCEYASPEWDAYHWLMRWFRKPVDRSTHCAVELST